MTEEQRQKLEGRNAEIALERARREQYRREELCAHCPHSRSEHVHFDNYCKGDGWRRCPCVGFMSVSEFELRDNLNTQILATIIKELSL